MKKTRFHKLALDKATIAFATRGIRCDEPARKKATDFLLLGMLAYAHNNLMKYARDFNHNGLVDKSDCLSFAPKGFYDDIID